MMRWIGKNIGWIVCTLVLGMVLLLCANHVKAEPLSFSVAGADETVKITVFDGADETCYVFLPAYAEMEHVRVNLGSGKRITIGDSVLTDGMDCGAFSLETDYPLQDQNGKSAVIRFCRSANVASVHIETATGTMRHIHLDKDREEKATVRILRPDGTREYFDEVIGITGRGNSTWGYQKKPYALRLSKNAELFGMSAASDWVLLANAADSSNLNNRIVLDLAAQVGDVWVPQCSYVDVYLNGEYNGLYLLTEKVEAAPGKLEIDTEAGDFLCDFRFADNEEELSYCVFTDVGRSAMILAPQELDHTQKNRIAGQILEMEREILSGQDLADSAVIDLDSWVRRYILDEISSNVDADRASCYFFYTNGKFYAGPIWDYDKGFGNCQQSRNPWSFTADNEKRSAFSSLPYYRELCGNASFQKRVREIYAAEFLPLLNAMADGGISLMASEISASASMDSIRWYGLTPAVQSPVLIPTNADSVTGYLREKIRFLSSAWIDGVDYCTVQFELAPGAEYINYAVEKGTVFSAEDIDTRETVWIVAETGAVFDFSQPVTDDVILHLQAAPSEEPQESDRGTVSAKVLVTVASLLAMGVILVSMAGLELYRARKGGRPTDEN